MSEPRNFIEINGRKYDTNTGQVVGSVTKVFKPTNNTGVVDSITARPGHKKTHRISALDQPHKKSQVSRTKNNKNRTPEKSKILMRPAVKKPKITVTQSHTEQKRPTLNPVNHHERLKRAKNVSRSERIAKFSPVAHRVLKKTVDHVPVVQGASIGQTLDKEVHTSEPIKQVVNRFEQAVTDATSHLEEYVEEHSPKRFRKAGFAAVSLSTVLLCGFLVYNAIPQIKVKLAGRNAGFTASLPSYSPAGYGLDSNIDYTSGKVSLAYSSRTDDKGYNISQQPSDWNSETLLNNYVIPISKTYKTIDINGKTVYTYNDSNASWVDGGIWYKLEGNAVLTTDQLSSIVNGL